MLIDTHAHIMFPEFKNDIDDVIARAKMAGVEKIINIGCDLKSCSQSLEMAEKYENLYATLGMHPYEAAFVNEKLMKEWEILIAGNKKIVAIGECGLDYFKAKIPKDIQAEAFRLQLELAQKVGLPVIVHNREADLDSLEILKEFDGSNGKPRVNIVFHCFGSDVGFARELWYRGYMTSFTGIVTYPSAKNLHDVVSEVPLDLFMVETDCPYLAPQTHRGGRNEPAYVVEVARKIAELRGVSFKEVERLSTENAMRFYGV